MNFASWPEPPMCGPGGEPEVPGTVRIYGVEYDVVEGSPMLACEPRPLDKDRMWRGVVESFSAFLDALQTLDGAHLDRIRDAHARLNEEINMAKVHEVSYAVGDSGRRKREAARKVLAAMEALMEK